MTEPLRSADRPSALRRWLGEPVDGASAGAFRALFGAIMLVSCARFAANGWIDEFYLAPAYHFAWPGFEWLSPWPRELLYLHFFVMALAAAGIALGVWYRASSLTFFLAFSCVELFDKTYYLNHYYLVSLIALLLCAMPLGRAGLARACRVPRWALVLLRGQLALVYFHAGLAKLDADWLAAGQPLSTWLSLYADLPVVGPLLALPATALAMSWAGAIFDLSVPALLCWPRTRGFAYAMVVLFHAATGLLLPIGIFPWLMIGLTTIFLAPDWPRRLARRLGAPTTAPIRPVDRHPLSSGGAALVCGYLALQLALPLRHLGYPGPVNWTEEGFRFAWRVMLIEKTGRVELRVHDPASGRQWSISPHDELTPMQAQMMATQPDMIAQYARHVAAEFARRGTPGVEVYADAWASLNARPAQRLIDPREDLAQPDGVFRSREYILPLVHHPAAR